MSNHIGDPELGGFRPLTVALLDSMPAAPKLVPVALAPAHTIDQLSVEQHALVKRVKSRMSSARYMCVECCMDKGRIPSHWYWEWKAELHEVIYHHKVVRI